MYNGAKPFYHCVNTKIIRISIHTTKTVNLPSDKKFLINSWQLGIANQMGKFYLIKVFALLWYCAHTQSTKVASSIKKTK